ncbi:MAG: DUF1080 domain-containing protein [Planctomycetota bacterium]|nr:MAG: DUF1080 domain-containing protein [Planctomycetota bacterium]
MTGSRLWWRQFAGASTIVSLFVLSHLPAANLVKEWKSGIEWPEPPVVDPGPDTALPVPPPSDAIILFDGKDLSQWTGGEDWIIRDGVAISAKHSISTKRAFGDCQLHIEFSTPTPPKGRGQGRGNSGVYLMGRYEVQILDSYKNKTYFDGQCGAIYKQYPPSVNACRPPGQWQSYDIIFEAPRFDDEGHVVKKAVITVLHNGVVIHNHVELLGATAYDRPPQYRKHPAKAPITLQYHGNPVRFRNIWIRENIAPLKGRKSKSTGTTKGASSGAANPSGSVAGLRRR